METNKPIKKLTPGQIISKYQSCAPVDVVAIAQELGINVWESSDLDPEVAGKLFIDSLNGGPSGFSMVIRKSDPLPRKRFTVAHETAHYILHRAQFQAGSDLILHRGVQVGGDETEANQLAAQILMPFPLIQKLIREGVKTTDDLARRLGVSKAALGIRLGMMRM